MAEQSRRDFLKTLLGGAAVAALPGAGCVSSQSPAPQYDVTPYFHGTDTSNTLVLAVGAYPELVTGGAGAITATSSLLPNPILVVEKEGGYDAVSAICTHVGCPLGYDGQDVVCPCHQSKFDPTTGHVLNPPALASLTSYPTSYDAANGALTIELPPPLPAPVNGVVTLSFGAFPNLAPQQACAQAFVVGTPLNSTQKLLVQALPDGTYAAVDPVCPHLGGPVSFNCGENFFLCAWHGSEFAPDGSLLKGPATTGLNTYPVTVTADGLSIRIS